MTGKRPWLLLVLSALSVLLAACGTAPAPKSSLPSPAPGIPTVKNTPPALPKAGSGHGGYYQDDGPGEVIPPDLESTVDPIPTLEPLARSGNKPYAVFGKTYTPLIDPHTPFKQRGTASWYGKKFHGKRTSSGEPYDMYKITAAHPTLPIPSYARVTNVANGKQIIVRINDRGPFRSSRIMDLSYTAALKLGYLGNGSSEIEVERLLPEDIAHMAENRSNQSRITLPAQTPPQEKSDAQTGMDELIASFYPEKTKRSGYYVQFGAFAIRANAETILQQLRGKTELPDCDIVQSGNLYRLLSGPYANREQASNAMTLANRLGLGRPLIVQQ